MHLRACFAITIALALASEAVNPGIRLRLTDKGLQYVASIGVEVLKEKLNSLTIPDIHGDAGTPVGHISYDLTSVKITSLSLPSYSLKPVANVGLQFAVSGVSVALSGHWHYREDHWPHISDSGSVDVSASGISFSVSVALGADSKGRPTVSAAGCSCSIGSVSITLHGGASWLYNLFDHEIEGKIKSALQSQLCSAAKDSINNQGAKALANFPTTRKLDKFSEINYSLVQKPAPTAAFLDVMIKGEFESAVHPVEAPFSPAPLPADTADKYMVYVWLTDYVINTAGLVYMKSGFMNRTVTQADLPKDFKFPLNTNTFKVIVYQLYNKYPDRPVRLKVYPTQSPAISSDVGGVNVSLVGHVEFYVDLQNGSSVFAFSLGLNIAATAQIAIKDTNLTVHASFVKVDPSLVKSAIGNIEPNINLMKMFLNSFVDKLIINELNKYGDQGFPLPMIDGGKLVSPQISSGKHFTLVSSNVDYHPSDTQDLDEISQEFGDRRFIKIV
ncbi:predicted protein [Nematostella vectensis]|uniref:Bactericidal permeability-increasing protein n=1 Tax=Nematostella vectensis TaxID=45351 RepID=A7SGM5_NEMVE|nr:lipopolysaccharide-binding protein [Nematostella vectensis]EDO37094.1 predicted protein [Nematostella vectensis]|eukprot:XP_001629157.1 predicted protein [Nematostella vectensis]